MVGTPLIGAWIAHLGFWALLVTGVASTELRPRTAGIVAGIWAVTFFGLPRASEYGWLLVTPIVAILDVGLVLTVFKSDVRLR